MKKRLTLYLALGLFLVVAGFPVDLPGPLELACTRVRPGMLFTQVKDILNPIAGAERYDGKLGRSAWYYWYDERGSVFLEVDRIEQRVLDVDWLPAGQGSLLHRFRLIFSW
jgi:hypothetical protein